jgi:hypothetical protein
LSESFKKLASRKLGNRDLLGKRTRALLTESSGELCERLGCIKQRRFKSNNARIPQFLSR